MDISKFIEDNYVIIIIITAIIVMTIIGYVAQKTEFGKKVSAKNNKKNNTVTEQTEPISETIIEEITDDNESSKTQNIDSLDNIAPDFNDGQLVLGDVNLNPDISNDQLGISEDLYAPFGDENLDANTQINTFDASELKIEEVPETDEFNIIEPEKFNQVETIDEQTFENLNVPLTDSTNATNYENLIIEEVNPADNENQINDLNISNDEEALPEPTNTPIVSEINDIVDNTLVINNDVEELKQSSEPSLDIFNSELPDSKIQKFAIEEDNYNEDNYNNETTENTSQEFDLDITTNLQLDEINEKIKNLKLEDLDNPIYEEEPVTTNTKKKKNNKKINVKSVDEIKNENKNGDKIIQTDERSNVNVEDIEMPILNNTDNNFIPEIETIDLNNNLMNSAESININEPNNDPMSEAETIDLNQSNDTPDDIINNDLELPNLDDISTDVEKKNDNNVEETDNIWQF